MWRLVLLLGLSGCAHRELGSTGLQADMQNGIRGFIGDDGDGPDPREPEGWARLRTLDIAVEAFLAAPPMRWQSTPDLLARVQALVALEALASEVFEVGSARPGVAAFVRLGLAYEATHAWIEAPEIAPLYRSPLYRTVYGLGLAGRGAPSPYPLAPPSSDYIGTGCPPAPTHDEKAIAAYAEALRLGWRLELHGDPNLGVALARLSALDPEHYPPRYERIPLDDLGYATEP